MILRNLIFKLEVIKQRLPAGLVSHHEQASKANREQQHRVLWPAYNPNLAPRQASTEGLFQQTLLVASIDKQPVPGSARRKFGEGISWLSTSSGGFTLSILVFVLG